MSQKTRINHLLMQNGLGKLDDPGLIPQLGFLMGRAITTHEHFRDMLNKCEPKERRNMYEAMRPYLSFEVKPLDVYIAELGSIAEAKQLPVVTEDGKLKPFKVVDIQTREPLEEPKDGELALAQSLIEEAAAVKHLQMECGRCSAVERFHGWNKDAAIAKARTKGWVHDILRKLETCPDCFKRLTQEFFGV